MRLNFRLREKIIAITVITIIFSSGINLYLNLRGFIKVYKEAISSRVFVELSGVAGLVNDLVEMGLAPGELVGLNKECARIVQAIPYAKYCFIMGKKGEVFYHNIPQEAANVYTDTITQESLQTDTDLVQYYRSNSGEKIYDFSKPIQNIDGERIATVRLGILSGVFDKEVLDIVTHTIWSSLTFIFIAIVIIFFLSRFSILIPIRNLMTGVSQIGKGNLDSRIEIKTKDEFAELARAFNKMAEDLSVSMQKEKELAVAAATAESEKIKAEELAGMNEELESTNEEISQTIEELQSATEELRKANEEAKKAKEEAENKTTQLERFNKVAVGRELRMKEMKEEIDGLLKELGRASRYGKEEKTDKLESV